MESARQYLPPEIIFEILVRLPVKSLCRFRCVSPFWHSMISSPHFIESHFAHSSSRPTLLISCLYSEHDRGCSIRGTSFYSMNYSNRENQLQTLTKHGKLTWSHSPRCPDILQSVGGQVLVQLGDVIRIYNPSTRESVADVTTQNPEGTHAMESFLGFDPIGKIHKILCTFLRFSLEQHGPWFIDYKVLALDGKNQWRTISDGHRHLITSNSICLDGVIYYITGSLAEPQEQQSFIGFDVRSESFRMMELPSPLKASSTSATEWHLVELHGRVAIVHNYDLTHGEEIDLWVFEGFNQRQSWSCKRILLPLSWKHIYLLLLGGTQTGELLFRPLFVDQPCRLFYFDMETNRARECEIPGLLDVLPHPHSSHGYTYWNIALSFRSHVESLWSASGDLPRRAS
ncbi:hypothetical protein CDL15_Pgr013668 [Punica granatum]|uniref:F-box domain-containing protein n=1 Tax=Punica granatum TaxID=22663 RepID=A0A218W2I7_PUNGR|nr:hypothetical protein CDL15_Pgr013668 [Punica granatum]PKH63921.1 hypothetical protein CRG98_050218 [Punica granatum]